MHISNISINIHNRIAHIILDNTVFNNTNSSLDYMLDDDTLYINSNLHSTYSILVNSITMTNDASVCANIIFIRFFSMPPINAADSQQQIVLKTIYNDTMVRIYESIVPTKYTFNASTDIFVSDNYSAPTMYLTLTFSN